MSDKVVSVLTFKSIETMLSVGGTQSWTLDPERAKSCKYAVVCRNANTREAEGPEEHGSAFMIGIVEEVVPSTETAGRWLIKFSHYAKCELLDQWGERRNPVAYWTTDDYDLDFESLEFLPMPKPTASAVPAKAENTLEINLPAVLSEGLEAKLREGAFMDAGEYIRYLIRKDMATY